MVDSDLASAGYAIPRYRAPDDVTWYHVLHGNVPNHQIDFMYCPEVPQGPLTPTHFSHLARLMKYIEPQTNNSHAFAIGNLSRDDTQHEAGHGAVGLIFGMRVGGATDHAGRRNPPFAHGVLTVDRDLTYATLLEASATFYRHVMNAGEARSSIGDFYGEYVRSVVDSPELVPHVLARYVEQFGDLPRLRRSGLPWSWVADEDAPKKRVVIVHDDDAAFGVVAHAAAKIGALLYRSNVRWTSITTGREADIPGGVSVHFVAERDVTTEDRRAGLVRIEDLAEDEAEIARSLFGAKPKSDEGEGRKYAGWRERYASQVAMDGDAAAHALPPPRRAFGSSPPAREAPPQKGEHGTEIIERSRLEAAAAARGSRAELPGAPGVAGAHAGAAGAMASLEQTGRSRGAAAAAAALAGAGAGAVAAKGAAGNAKWRDVGVPPSVPPPSGGPASSRNGVGSARAPSPSSVDAGGSDDIEVTIEKPPSSSKTWLLVAIGVVCVAAVVAFFAFPTPQPGSDPTPSAPTPAPSAGPGATGGAPVAEPQGATTPEPQSPPAPTGAAVAPPPAGEQPRSPTTTSQPPSGSTTKSGQGAKGPPAGKPRNKPGCSVFSDKPCF
jgi:hypothetical protein